LRLIRIIPFVFALKTSYEGQRGEKPSYGVIYGFDHVHWIAGNAKQAASWFVTRFGFQNLAYRGLETGSRDIVTHVVKQGKIVFAFSSCLTNKPTTLLGTDMSKHLSEHGDGVIDVAFHVEDCRAMYRDALARGAVSVSAPEEIVDGDHGSVILASVKAYDDTVHTFVERTNYSGPFLPGYRAASSESDPLSTTTPPPLGDGFIDHVVGNTPDNGMLPVVNWYENVLQFHKFWSVDDKQIHTEFSSLRSIVVASYEEHVKMPINEPAAGLRKSQIQEYVEYYNGSGVQHIALNTRNILDAITYLRARGVEFLRVPDAYYKNLRERLASQLSHINIKEDLDMIQKLNILVDFDEKGYLLQLFTRCIQDRPTVFLEVIQREGCEGFGAGNFQSLFEAIEREQAERGNLV
jgi:4-hydroxyphenylpyruvate dioxygenase